MNAHEKDPLDDALSALFDQFTILSHAGYGGGPLAGEQGVYRLTVPFYGKVMEGITTVSNLPVLRYNANPTRVIQDAVFKWLYVLTSVLSQKESELAYLRNTYRWEMRLAAAAEESRQLQLFRQFLATKCAELGEGAPTMDTLREIKTAAWDEAPSPTLRLKCTHIVAHDPKVRAVLAALPYEEAEGFTSWLEAHVYG